MSRLRDMWEFLTKFPALHRAILAEFDEHNTKTAGLQRQVDEADAARRHAQEQGTKLVERVRWLENQLRIEEAASRVVITRLRDEMEVRETIASVTTWANETFGQATIWNQIVRAKKEFQELIAADLKDGNKIAEEAADVCICLYRVIGTLDPEAINKKMKKNRARKWQVDGQGCAQHVGE